MAKLSPEDVQRITDAHDAYWEEQRATLRLCRAAYMTEYWAEGQRNGSRSRSLVVETSRGYEYIEAFIASLFARNPSVKASEDIRGRGKHEVGQAVANEWLLNTREVNEDASRLALIYPCAFLKLSPCNNADLFKRVDKVAVPPWDIIVDDDAPHWDRQRFVMHRYWMTVREAEEKWGGKEYEGRRQVRWIAQQSRDDRGDDREEVADFDKSILVYEVYDLLDNRILFWSPDFKNGKEWVYDGIKLEIAGETKVFNEIPFTDADDKPLVPIIPLYFSRLPDNPLRGYSAMKRVYDQTVEMNVVRTFQANAVRKAARQWFVRRGVLQEDEMARIQRGDDGAIIEVDLPPGTKLSDIMAPVAHTETPAETYKYTNEVQDDWDRGSIMAPFTRGQTSDRATATEITALAAYSSTEVGRLARVRDAATEAEAALFVAMVRKYLGDDGKDMVVIDQEVTTIREGDLAGNFRFFALDSGSTPVSDAQRKGEFVSNISSAVQIGVPDKIGGRAHADRGFIPIGNDKKTALRREFVRLFELPKDFDEDEEIPATPEPGAGGVAGGTVIGEPPLQPSALGLGPGQQPSPGQVSTVL